MRVVSTEKAHLLAISRLRLGVPRNEPMKVIYCKCLDRCVVRFYRLYYGLYRGNQYWYENCRTLVSNYLTFYAPVCVNVVVGSVVILQHQFTKCPVLVRFSEYMTFRTRLMMKWKSNSRALITNLMLQCSKVAHCKIVQVSCIFFTIAPFSTSLRKTSVSIYIENNCSTQCLVSETKTD